MTPLKASLVLAIVAGLIFLWLFLWVIFKGGML